jgi:PTH1 family peptidyl-tRNA hydrolase
LTWLVVGLGNPGPTYARNRHNVGAMVVHELARRGAASWKTKRLAKADLAEVRLGAPGERVVVGLTRTYMNQSGIPVRNLLAEVRARPDHLIVVHDELDLDLGQLRVKFGGGDNGHNGLKSIRALGGGGEYYRVRIGIGRPDTRLDVTDWVLTNFAASEQDTLAQMIAQAADAVESLIQSGLAPTQAAFNN